MKIGLCKDSLNPDTNLKYMLFEANGETHNIMFRYTHRKGIEAEDLIFDGYPAKLIDGYPPLLKVVQICASFIYGDMRSIMRDFVHRMKGRNR